MSFRRSPEKLIDWPSYQSVRLDDATFSNSLTYAALNLIWPTCRSQEINFLINDSISQCLEYELQLDRSRSTCTRVKSLL